MKARLVSESLGIFQPKDESSIDGFVKSLIKKLVDKISIKEFEDELLGPLPGSETDEFGMTRDELKDSQEVGSRKISLNKEGDYVILSNDSEVLNAIEHFAYEYEMEDVVNLLDVAKQQDKDRFEKYVAELKGQNIDPKDMVLTALPESVDLLDTIFDQFVEKFKLEW